MSSDTKSNQEKNVLVTGGGRGIGRGIVESLAADGWNVVLCGRSDPSRYADFIESIRQKYLTSVAFLSHDISDVDGHDAFLREVYRKVGRLDALVNNAGVAPLVRADILEASVESFDRVLGINLRGPYFLTQKVAQQFLRDRQADSAFSPMIVNIGSISATTVSTSRGEYCVSKAGVAMMTRLFAARLAEYGIPVYELRPGIVHSDMTAAVEEKYDRLISEGLVPQRRWGEPSDVGRAVAMLLRGELAYSTGQVIHIGGGMDIQQL